MELWHFLTFCEIFPFLVVTGMYIVVPMKHVLMESVIKKLSTSPTRHCPYLKMPSEGAIEIYSHFPCFKCPLKKVWSSSGCSFQWLKTSRFLKVFIPPQNTSSVTLVKNIQPTESNTLGLTAELDLWRSQVVCMVQKKSLCLTDVIMSYNIYASWDIFYFKFENWFKKPCREF